MIRVKSEVFRSSPRRRAVGELGAGVGNVILSTKALNSENVNSAFVSAIRCSAQCVSPEYKAQRRKPQVTGNAFLRVEVSCLEGPSVAITSEADERATDEHGRALVASRGPTRSAG